MERPESSKLRGSFAGVVGQKAGRGSAGISPLVAPTVIDG